MQSSDTKKTIPGQALDHPVKITSFPSQRALAKKELNLSLRTLATQIEQRMAASKDKLPWLKLATFGDTKSEKGCLRTNANVATITGLEADYDAGKMTPEEARDRLVKAGLAALIYTTPSHMPEAPRWRVLCPFSGPLPPDAREDHMARLNGVLGGQLAGESFTLSQAYYAGGVEGGQPVQTFLVDGGYLDKVTGLKSIYKDGGKTKPERNKSTGEKTGLPFADFKAALMAVPNDDSNPKADNREWWLGMLAALRHETDGGEEGLELAHDWSALHPSYDADATEEAWQSFRRGTGKTGATILSEARFNGWSDNGRLLDDLFTPEELAAIADESLDDETRATIERLVGTPGQAAASRSRLTFLSPSDCEHLPTRRYVIKGLLAEGDVAAIVGAPGAGKSLLAPYLGYAVAQGAEVFNRRTRQGGVLYVAAEDSHGMRARMKALRAEHGEAEAFTLVEGVSDLLNDKSNDLKDLIQAVKERRPALIVIDTLAAAFAGLEENDAKSMGVVVRSARALTRWGAAVILVHHDTKAGDGLPRGHSILNGALDMSLHLQRDGSVVRCHPTKNRNGSIDQKLAFSVGVVQQGVDEDGDSMSTAICDEEDAATLPARGKALPASVKAALDILQDLCHGQREAPIADWRAACLESAAVSAADNVQSRRQTFRRAVEELARRDLIASHDGVFSLTKSDGEVFTDDDV
jgi:archaellum biogenesis ATPase FlaH